MNKGFYIGLLLCSVFISAVSQVVLKKAAMKTYVSRIREYLNFSVIAAYSMFVLATFLTIFAYRSVSLSLGAVLDATSYIYVTVFGVLIFKEKISKRKIVALILIMSGVLTSSLLG